MFSFIRRARRAVTREEAAESIGISRKLAAFHLDKMVDAGLLRARYESAGDEPRVGRRPKVYEPIDTPISVSIPGRRYDLLADLLLEAVVSERVEEGASAGDAAVLTARERGVQLGRCQREQLRPGRLGSERGLRICESMLEEHGYEPARESLGQIRLRNCPFHPLADKAPDLVCGMNQAFLGGYLRGLQISGVDAVLVPSRGECCVRLTTAGPQTACSEAPVIGPAGREPAV